MKVTVFTTTTCPYCQMLKRYLKEHDIEYMERLVDEDEEAREVMVKESGGFLGVPFTVVEKDDGKETIVGFDKGKVNSVFELS
jgi:glutaredoxin 3